MFETTILAASKVIKDKIAKEARRLVEAGEHRLNFVLHVTGSMIVNEPEEYKPTNKIPTKWIIAALLKRSGAVCGANQNLLREIMEEALNAETDTTAAEALSAQIQDLDRIMAEVMQPVIDALPKAERPGKVLTKDLEYDIIPL